MCEEDAINVVEYDGSEPLTEEEKEMLDSVPDHIKFMQSE